MSGGFQQCEALMRDVRSMEPLDVAIPNESWHSEHEERFASFANPMK
jgi:hypothetical protein